jgi:hypothetical protein
VSVRQLLDGELRPHTRLHHLTTLTGALAAAPLDETVADLRAALKGRITMEDHRRLHVLISTLYHQAGAGLALSDALRAEVTAALNRTTPREEE